MFICNIHCRALQKYFESRDGKVGQRHLRLSWFMGPAVGLYAIKLARNSNIHPIIAVAGKGMRYVESLVDRTKGDIVLDYRSGSDEVVRQIREHPQAGEYGEVRHRLDPGIGLPSQKRCSLRWLPLTGRSTSSYLAILVLEQWGKPPLQWVLSTIRKTELMDPMLAI